MCMGWYVPDFLVGVWCTSKNKFGGYNNVKRKVQY